MTATLRPLVDLELTSIEIEASDVFYANRAAAFLGAKKYDRALKDCESSLNLNPKNIKAIRRAISACVETGEYEKGLSYCEKFNDMGF